MTPENNQQQTDGRTAPEHVSVHDESATSDGVLERGLGGAAATAIIMGGMIGSGIFRAPSIVADHAGSPGMSLTVWAVCGLVALCGGLCVAELGAMMPKTGGLYVYLREAFRSRFIAFSYGWAAFWLIWPVSMAAVAADASLAASDAGKSAPNVAASVTIARSETTFNVVTIVVRWPLGRTPAQFTTASPMMHVAAAVR